MGNHSKLCRLCAIYNKKMSSIQLFERTHKGTLRKISQLSGLKLKNHKSYPSAVCSDCELELNRAYDFRVRCISAEAYFSSAEYKGKTRSNSGESGHESESHYYERTLLKLEVNPCKKENETTTSDFEVANQLILPLKSDDTVATEFIVVNEEVTAPLKKDDGVDRLNREFEYEMDTSVYCDKTEVHIKPEVESLVRENDALENVTTSPVLNTPKSEHRQKKHVKPKGTKKDESKIYICHECGNNFTSSSHFATHIKRHTGVKPLQCEVCPNKFFTQGELKRHMRRHTGERPFACQHCDRRFTDYSTRSKHERTHTNDRPFACSQCGKDFTRNYLLKNHMLVHSGERSYRCTICKKAFQRQTHLVVHTRSLTHKQNVERAQCELAQKPKVEATESFPLQISAENT